MLTNLSDAQTFLSLDPADTSQNALLNLLLPAADAAVKQWCKRDLEQQSYTEYYSGTGRRDLVLRQYPVAVSPAAQVWQDMTGYYGENPAGGFAAGTQLVYGTDYLLRGGANNTGILHRIGGVAGNYFVGTYFEGQYGGSLAARRLPVWPPGDGNLKVTYTAGFAAVPADLAVACLSLVGFLKRCGPGGAALQSESLGNYTYGVLATSPEPEVGTIRSLLAQYRDHQLGR